MKELDEIRARLEAATPGPWQVNEGEVVDGGYCNVVGTVWPRGAPTRQLKLAPNDAELIANAPTDLARLLAAIQAIEALTVDPEHYDSQGPSNGYVSVDNIRAAITAALTPTPAVPSGAGEPRGAGVAPEGVGAEIGPEQALSGADA